MPLAAQAIATTYRPAADSLIRAATGDSAAYDRVGRLVDGFGHRLAGSRSLEAAIDWVLAEMKKDGLQNVRGEPVKVTHWVRGAESVVLVRPRRDTLGMLGLGRQRGHAEGGDHRAGAGGRQLRGAGAAEGRRRGKIVLFDAPFTTYPETRHYRTDGPSRRGTRRSGGLSDPVGGLVLDPEPAHRPDRLRQHRAADPGRGARAWRTR